MTFQEKVKFVRKRLNISQEDLARQLNVSFATVNRWEKKGQNPSRLGKASFDEFCKKHQLEEI